jgi:hypothetical protein
LQRRAQQDPAVARHDDNFDADTEAHIKCEATGVTVDLDARVARSGGGRKAHATGQARWRRRKRRRKRRR